ncbi:MarR family winged helix-turn-helix transcriptional regulator [Alicyclobacillus fodiniaquatilis]|uniref:MarR family winged helix-turn-helix transcriptional regulator n=1 Tax=Alicyclobacillus fodiniaquatilis TaxID=1661150 RepID=A0ABW4JJ61_9BACL
MAWLLDGEIRSVGPCGVLRNEVRNIFTSENPTVQKLFHSFMRFKRVKLHGGASSGRKPSDVRVLFCIKRGEEADVTGVKVSDISHHLNVAAPTITQLIKGLEESGLVERKMDEADRRVIRVKLTDEGEKTIQQAHKELSDTLDGLISYLGEEDSNQLAELLAKVCQYYSERQLRSFGDD